MIDTFPKVKEILFAFDEDDIIGAKKGATMRAYIQAARQFLRVLRIIGPFALVGGVVRAYKEAVRFRTLYQREPMDDEWRDIVRRGFCYSGVRESTVTDAT